MKKTTTAAVAILGLVALASTAFAGMEDQKKMKAAYEGAKVNCGTCHAAAMPKKGAADLNAYGKDYETAKKDLKAIEAKDSDGDGKSNLDEIKAGTNPGAK